MAEVKFKNSSEVAPVNTIYCVGRNYAAHASELNNPIPKTPIIFIKPATALISSGQSVILPLVSSVVHYEVEVVALIGKKGKHISLSSALDYIAGYGIGIDVTARDIQQRAKEKSQPWAIAKGFDTFAPLSDIVKPSEIGDPAHLSIKLFVNSKLRQSGATRNMLFPLPNLISYMSTVFTLMPGDLIFTGTPAGVGPLNENDHLEAVLGDRLVTLTVKVERE